MSKMDNIKLSAMGRDIHVGDLYDYTDDQVASTHQDFKRIFDTPSNSHYKCDRSVVSKTCVLLEPISRDMKMTHLDINSHHEASIEAGLLPCAVWFQKYLEEGYSPNTIPAYTPRISVHLKIITRSETVLLNPENLDTKLKAALPQIVSATHLVTGVTYGFEAVFVFEVPHHYCQNLMDKDFFESRLFLEATEAFAVFKQLATLPELIEEQHMEDKESILNAAICCCYTNAPVSLVFGTSFPECLESFKRLALSGLDENFVPIEITLTPVASVDRVINTSPQRIHEVGPDLMRRIFLIKESIRQVSIKLDFTMQDPLLLNVPHLQERLQEFARCLVALQAKTVECIKSAVVEYRKSGSKDAVETLGQLWESQFSNQILIQWIMERQREMFVLKNVLRNVSIPWKPENIRFVDNRTIGIFTFQTKQLEDPVISKLQADMNISSGGQIWTTFELFSFSRQEQDSLRVKIEDFRQSYRSNNAFLGTSNISEQSTFERENSPSHQFKSPSQKTLSRLNNPTPVVGLVRLQSTTKMETRSASLSPSSASSKPDERTTVAKKKAAESITRRLKPRKCARLSASPSPLLQSSGGGIADNEIKPLDHDQDVIMLEMVDEEIQTHHSGAYDTLYQGNLSKRVAEEFASRSPQVKGSHPAVYLLKSDERIVQSGVLRWFDIGKPNRDVKCAHKVIILMGATGCGKSTLIHGMVNYILGVEWSDPFRFRIVSDGASDQVKSQAHSQTSFVTAYTIHHLEGMKIPYGITIIDTPGFGDTGGVERDEEITRMISKFLCHPETDRRLEFVNAVCFVASTADSRLTPTQQYVLDSMASTFGKDIRNHFKLLVTFSDGMTPPVLEAIRQAGIPGLSDVGTGTVPHHKFNNSALFADNASDKEGTSFDGAYWKLGRNSFHSFFDKLAAMTDQSLRQTQLIIKYKDELKKAVQEIDNKLDAIASAMQTVEDLEQSLIVLERKLENCKNFEAKSEINAHELIPLTKGMWAYNCGKCLKTCQKGSTCGSRGKPSVARRCSPKIGCLCPGRVHTIESFEHVMKELVEVKIDMDLKEQYDSISAEKLTTEEDLRRRQQKLTDARVNGVVLLRTIHRLTSHLKKLSLQSSKIRSVSDYVNSIRNRLLHDQGPGHLTRVRILDELRHGFVVHV